MIALLMILNGLIAGVSIAGLIAGVKHVLLKILNELSRAYCYDCCHGYKPTNGATSMITLQPNT